MRQRSFPSRIPEEELAAYIDGRRPIQALDRWITEFRLGIGLGFDGFDPRVLRAIAACRSGAPPDLVARYMDWRGFEAFCAVLLNSMGYCITQNILLKKPRAQIDILARGLSASLLVDCKHWSRTRGWSALSRAAVAQGLRAERLRTAMPGVEPMAVVIVSLGDERARFVGGAAVVPVHTLADFSSKIEEYSAYLTMR